MEGKQSIILFPYVFSFNYFSNLDISLSFYIAIRLFLVSFVVDFAVRIFR